jgi:hypothetical protein
MIREIERKMEELEEEEKDRPRKMREDTIDNIKSACQKEELEMPKFKEIIEKYSERINSASLNDIRELKAKATKLIELERFKRQRLHWRREPYS